VVGGAGEAADGEEKFLKAERGGGEVTRVRASMDPNPILAAAHRHKSLLDRNASSLSESSRIWPIRLNSNNKSRIAFKTK
jgi:hypothetical protein